MELSIFTIFGGLIFPLVWGFAVIGLIDGLGPFVKRLKKTPNEQRNCFSPYYLAPKG